MPLSFLLGGVFRGFWRKPEGRKERKKAKGEDDGGRLACLPFFHPGFYPWVGGGLREKKDNFLPAALPFWHGGDGSRDRGRGRDTLSCTIPILPLFGWERGWEVQVSEEEEEDGRSVVRQMDFFLLHTTIHQRCNINREFTSKTKTKI